MRCRPRQPTLSPVASTHLPTKYRQAYPSFMRAFVREAQVVASLHHPNIVQVHDFQTFPPESGNTTAYMVMDYVQGQTLNEYIRNTSRLGNFPPASEIIHLFGGISSAIDYAH